jgi:broad-specificity NMP kinase
MKLVKKYEAFIGKEISQEFDADFAMAKIKHFYSEYEVKDLFDDELPNWVDDSVYQNFEDVCDWFYDNSIDDSDLKKNIAISVSDVVTDQLMDWYEREFKIELTEPQREELSKRIIKTYEGIDPNNW